jgi:signal transduction histidine kinase/CheY-like chemotaxis protein
MAADPLTTQKSQTPEGLDLAFEHAPDPIVFLSADGAMIAANAAFRAAFKQRITPERPPWGRNAPPPFQHGTRVFEAATPDGRRFEWLEQQTPDGRRVASARDVTDRARAADEAARAKTVLFATLTHELRTPLNGILGMADLLRAAQLAPAERDWLQAIERSGEHLLDLITEILDYSRLEAGRVALEDAPFDPEDTAQGVAELLSPKARAKGLEIAVALAPGVPAKVRGDDGRVRQILFNLVGNAVKFTEAGGVRIEIAPAREANADDPRAWLRFSVVDTGPGVPLEKQALIFEEFSQAEASINRRYGGAGLGLAIVRRLAGAMGGEVGLESRLGAGAVFWAELPFGRIGPAAGQSQSRPLQGVKLALVGVSPVLAAATTKTLNGLGANAVSAASAAAVRAAGVDVVLLDLNAESTANLAALEGGPPVILLAPQEDRALLESFRAQGHARYLIKPLRRRSLVEQVRLAHFGGVAPSGRAAPVEDARAAPTAALGLRILLAEDNPVNALLARTLLQRSGCVVELVSDGEQAVQAAAKGGFDVILLDLRMPLLDGLGAARRIRALKGRAGQAPMIALTADAGEEERTAALAAGMDDFITKPIDVRRLEAALAGLKQAAKPATLEP